MPDMLEAPHLLAHRENHVLAGMLLRDGLYRRGAACLKPIDLFDEQLGRILSVLLEVNEQTVESRFEAAVKKLPKPDRVRIAKLLVSYDHVGRCEYWFDAALRFTLHARRNRCAIELTNEISETAQSGDDVLGELSERIARLDRELRVADPPPEFSDLIAAAVESIEQQAATRRMIPLGIYQLDTSYGGLVRRELTTVAAKTGGGKSAFALQVATHNSKHGRRVVYFSPELDRTQLTWRILSNQCGINLGRFYDGKLSREDRAKIPQAHANLAELPLTIIDDPRVGIGDIRARLLEANNRTGGVDLVVVDYLQLLSLPNPKSSLRENIGEITRELKIIAGEVDAAVLLVSQLSREGIKPGTVPDLSHLKESGSIENDSGMVMFLYERQADREPGKPLWCHVRKCRHAGVGKTALTFNGEYQRFTTQQVDAEDNPFNEALR